jgi:putative transport protein
LEDFSDRCFYNLRVGTGNFVDGDKFLKIPMNLLVGMLAGAHTQPAVLGFALEQTRNELPNIGYASVLPTALIAKVIFAQLILAVLAAVAQ